MVSEVFEVQSHRSNVAPSQPGPALPRRQSSWKLAILIRRVDKIQPPVLGTPATSSLPQSSAAARFPTRLAQSSAAGRFPTSLAQSNATARFPTRLAQSSATAPRRHSSQHTHHALPGRRPPRPGRHVQPAAAPQPAARLLPHGPNRDYRRRRRRRGRSPATASCHVFAALPDYCLTLTHEQTHTDTHSLFSPSL